MQNKHKSLSFPYQSPLGELSILANEKYLLKISFSPSNLSPAETGKIPSHVIELINFLNRYFYNPNTIINTEIRIYRNDKLHSTLHTGKHDKVSRLHLDFTNITFNMEKIYIALLRIPRERPSPMDIWLNWRAFHVGHVLPAPPWPAIPFPWSFPVTGL